MTAAIAVTALALAVWCYLLAGHGGFWRTGATLPPESPNPHRWPDVVAVVPARDEADVLPDTLPTLLAQDYPGRFGVVLVDDDSGDGTGAVARALAGDRPLQVVAAEGPPPGWRGKVAAMQAGLAAAADARYVLFTDADIAHAPGTVTALVRAAEAHRFDLVSQMALLRAATGWERAIVPAFVYFFAQLYPFPRVNRPGARTAAAAGGCMLVRRAALRAAGGLPAIRHALIDDVALGALLKRRGLVWLGLSQDVASRRPYPRLADLWDMVARSAFTQLRHSPALLAGTVLGLTLVYLVPPAATLAGIVATATGVPGAVALLCLGAAAWALLSASFLPMLRWYRLGAWRAPVLPLVAALYVMMTVDSAVRHYRGNGGRWKGRVSAGATR